MTRAAGRLAERLRRTAGAGVAVAVVAGLQARTRARTRDEDPRPVDCPDVELLSDWGRQESKWDARRLQTDLLAERFEGIPDDLDDVEGSERIRKWAARLKGCAPRLVYGFEVDKVSGVMTRKLFQVWFCHVRTCPICGWRRALAWRARILKALPAIEGDHPGAEWGFLTLTTVNVKPADLRAEYAHLHQSFGERMKKLDAWKNAILGHVRFTEITRGKGDTVHAHLHVVLLLRPGYFTGPHYLSQKALRLMWRKSARLHYDPRVDIRKMYNLEKAVQEAMKYACKPVDMVEAPDAWLRAVVMAMHGKRLVAPGGVLRAYLRAEDPTDEEMLLLAEERAVLAEYGFETWTWGSRWRRYYRRVGRVPVDDVAVCPVSAAEDGYRRGIPDG